MHSPSKTSTSRMLVRAAALLLSLTAAIHIHAANTITQIAPADFGSNNAVAIGADGIPVIAHRQLDANSESVALFVTKCGNIDCTANNTTSLVDGSATHYQPGVSLLAIALPGDGLPVISYLTNNNLKLAKCGNAACTVGNVVTTLSTNYDGQHMYLRSTAITLSPTTGFPVIGYTVSVVGWPRSFVINCQTPSCSSSAQTPVAVLDNKTISKSSMAMGSDGLPIFSYVESVNDGHGHSSFVVIALKCGNVSCNSGNTESVVAIPAPQLPIPQTPRLVSTRSEHRPSIAIGANGLPVISFATYALLPPGEIFDEKTPTALTVALCKTPSCSVIASVSLVDNSAAQVGEANSITVPADRRPVISYYDSTGKRLKVAKCGNSSCSSQNRVSVVATSVTRHHDFPYGGFWSSIAVPADGRPIVSFTDQDGLTPGVALKVLRCGDAVCAP
jgi:hypothetical protein